MDFLLFSIILFIFRYVYLVLSCRLWYRFRFFKYRNIGSVSILRATRH